MRGHSSTRRSWPEAGQYPALQMSMCRRAGRAIVGASVPGGRNSFTDSCMPSRKLACLRVRECSDRGRTSCVSHTLKVPFSTSC